ncbi:MAG: putative glycosyltransferase [Lentimonas sp.]|jgi:predicted glycosyltransferase
MKLLLEAHHPADIHFFKFAIRKLLDRGHEIQMVARDRDVMRQLLKYYDWIPALIPKRSSARNRFPLFEMLQRQWVVARAIYAFEPDLVASCMGSYTQSAKLFGLANVIFTDSEFQHFNHRIAHPFGSEIHTPYCFYKDLGAKQSYYHGIHEMAFLSPDRFVPDLVYVNESLGLQSRKYVLIRLSAWNTLHDINHSGIGSGIYDFLKSIEGRYQAVICAEENALPADLRQYALTVPPERYHDVLAGAAFVLTEGASTASEAGCLGVPTVYVNSTEPRGYLQMLENDWNLVRSFEAPELGLACALDWLERIDAEELNQLQAVRQQLFSAHEDVTEYIVRVLESAARS